MIANSTIFIIDDDLAVRSSMQWLLESSGFNVTTYKSAEDFLSSFSIYQSGCIFLDVRMPKMNGIEFLEIHNKKSHQMPVVVLTGHGDIALAVQAMRRGAIHFIEKPFDESKLKQSINELFEIDIEYKKKRLQYESITARLSNLTTREREVFKLTLKENTHLQIAEILNISIKTVEAHKSKLMKKLHVKNYHQLYIMYTQYLQNR